MGEGGPIRCGRCKAYMNPYVRWASNGKSYTCNFCGCSNQTPDNYFCHIAPDGRRRDAGAPPLQLRLALPVAVLVWSGHVQVQVQATSGCEACSTASKRTQQLMPRYLPRCRRAA